MLEDEVAVLSVGKLQGRQRDCVEQLVLEA